MLKNSNESNKDYCRVFKTVNATSGQPYMTFDYTATTTSLYGKALPFIESYGNSQNCLGYAINKLMYVTTPEYADSVSSPYKKVLSMSIRSTHTATTYYPIIKSFIEEETDYTVAVVSKNDPISASSYIIAMRIIHGGVTVGNTTVKNDYHFLRQTNTGKWAGKNGDNDASIAETSDPDITGSGWGYDTNIFYEEPTIYFTISE